MIFLTSAVIIDNCDSFPLEELHQVQNGTAGVKRSLGRD